MWQGVERCDSVSVKLSYYRPREALKVPGSWGCQFVGCLPMKVVKLSALRTRRLYPQEIPLMPISVRDWVDNRATLRPEELSQWKLQITQAGIELAISRLVSNICATGCPLIPFHFPSSGNELVFPLINFLQWRVSVQDYKNLVSSNRTT